MTWSAFKSQVLEFLPLDATRAGASTLIANLTKAAGLDLAGFYPSANDVTESRLPGAVGSRVQNALLFKLPAGTQLRDARISSVFSSEHEIEGAPSIRQVQVTLGDNSSALAGVYTYDSGDWVKDSTYRFQPDGSGGWELNDTVQIGSIFVGDGPAETPADVAEWADGGLGIGLSSPVVALVQGDVAYRDAWQGKLTLVDWAERFSVIRGDCGFASFNKITGELLVPYFVSGEQELALWLFGRPSDFADGDEVAFNIRDAECVAAYVQAHIARTIDKNPRLAADHDDRFRRLRRDRYLELKGS